MNRPFQITRWESPKPPTPDFLTRLMAQEGLTPESIEIGAQTHTPEMIFDQTAVQFLVSGHVQYSFPGYGVIELNPGDMLEISPDVRHDIITSPDQPSLLLKALRSE